MASNYSTGNHVADGGAPTQPEPITCDSCKGTGRYYFRSMDHGAPEAEDSEDCRGSGLENIDEFES